MFVEEEPAELPAANPAEAVTAKHTKSANGFFDTSPRSAPRSATPHPACGHLLPGAEKGIILRDDFLG
jgi:hypothetical protein